MAQHQLSAALFTGVGAGGLVPRDPGRALMLEQFSALSGTPGAHLGMAYRCVCGGGRMRMKDRTGGGLHQISLEQIL